MRLQPAHAYSCAAKACVLSTLTGYSTLHADGIHSSPASRLLPCHQAGQQTLLSW